MNKPTAIVTGSSRGIGRAIARQLALDGFNVVVNYKINKEQAENVLAEIESAGGQGIVVGADISNPEDVRHLVDETIKTYGGVDVLVNNAGINKDQLMLRISDEEWHQLIHTNLDSAFYSSRAVIRHMMKKRYGRIINISSVVGISGNTGQAHYAAAKSGLLGFTLSLAQEYGTRGITANVVAPGFIQSDMTSALSPEQSAKIQKGIAAGRLGTPDDVAAAVTFLASPQAGYINGQVIRVDGGMSAI
jgi:3-oxoacyl-[acyl-carrier protein] reductase